MPAHIDFGVAARGPSVQAGNVSLTNWELVLWSSAFGLLWPTIKPSRQPSSCFDLQELGRKRHRIDEHEHMSLIEQVVDSHVSKPYVCAVANASARFDRSVLDAATIHDSMQNDSMTDGASEMLCQECD